MQIKKSPIQVIDFSAGRRYFYEVTKRKTLKQFHLLILLILTALSSFCQPANDTTDKRFQDDLLDHLVGKWNDTAIAHGELFTSDVEASWVLNHQYLLLHLKSHQVIPWWHVQMEYYVYIGYNHYKKRYTYHGMSIEGDEDLSEGFGYGYRNGNDFKTIAKMGGDTNIVQHYTWQPGSKTWLIQSRPEINGKEGELFLEMKLTPANSRSEVKNKVKK